MTKSYLCAFFTCALLLNTPCWAMQQEQELQSSDDLENQGSLQQQQRSKKFCLGTTVMAMTALSVTVSVPTAYFIISAIISSLQNEQAKCDYLTFLQNIGEQGSDTIAQCNFCKDSLPKSCNTTGITVDEYGLTPLQGKEYYAFLMSPECRPLVEKYCQNNSSNPRVRCYKENNPPQTYYKKLYYNESYGPLYVLSIHKKLGFYDYDYGVRPYLEAMPSLCHKNLIHTESAQARLELCYREWNMFLPRTNRKNVQQRCQKYMAAHVKDMRKRNKK